MIRIALLRAIFLSFLAKRLKNGMIIAFDDYYCFSKSALSGERKALLEFTLSDRRFNFAPYVQFGWAGMSFIVEDKSLIPQGADIHPTLPGFQTAGPSFRPWRFRRKEI